MRERSVFVSVMVGALALGVGCGDDVNGPPPRVATTIEKIAGDSQIGAVSEPLADSLVVAVADQHGNLLPGAAVTWSAVAGGGAPSAAATTTSASGQSRVRFTLGAPPGPQTVRASLSNGQSVTFTVTAATHPAGVVERSDGLAARPYAAAISVQDVVYISQLDNRRLSRVDLPTLGEVAFVTVGDVPTYLSFNAAGTRAYVANQFDQTIGVVDVATNAQTSSIAVPGHAFTVIPNADDTRLYVVTNLDRLYQIDRATGSVLASIPLAATGQSLAWHRNGYLLYVSTFWGGTALEIDTRSMTVVRTFETGMKAQGIAVARDGRELWVADEDLQKVDVFDLATGARITSIPVSGNAWGVAMTPDQKQVYVGLVFQGEVVVIDRATRTVVRRIQTGGAPRRIVFNRTGTLALVANESGFVTYIR